MKRPAVRSLVMYDIREVIAKNLKRLRAEKRINQETLAEKIGVSKETIAKTEIRQNWLGADNLNKIIEYFGIKPFELFIDEKDMQKTNSTDTVLRQIKEELKQELSAYIDGELQKRQG